MSDNARPVDETDLHAYVDGALDDDRRQVVEEHLRSDVEAAARVAAYQTQILGLHGVFDSVLDEPVPDRLAAAALAASAKSGVRYRVPAAIAAGLALFLAGAVSGWFYRGAAPAGEAENLRDFTRHAVAAHRIYVAERRHAVEVLAKEERHLVRWLSNRLGHELRVPVLVTKGFELVGGRLLASPDNAPAAQFMYQDANMRRLTLYVRQSFAHERTSFRFAGTGDVSMFYWIDAPFSYALAGQMDKAELLEVSRMVAEQISP